MKNTKRLSMYSFSLVIVLLIVSLSPNMLNASEDKLYINRDNMLITLDTKIKVRTSYIKYDSIANFTNKNDSEPIIPKPEDQVNKVIPIDPPRPVIPTTGITTNYNFILGLMSISSIGIVRLIKRKE